MRFPLLAAAIAALVLEGCGPEPVGPRSGETARLRLASASPDAGTLDLLVNGRTVAQAVGRTEVSPAAVLEAGSATGEVRATGSAAALASLPLALEAGKSYTVLVAGPRGRAHGDGLGGHRLRGHAAAAAADLRRPWTAATRRRRSRWISSGSGSCTRRRTRRHSIPISCRPARRWTPSPRCSRSRTAAWRSPPTWSGGRATGRSSSPRRGPRGSC